MLSKEGVPHRQKLKEPGEIYKHTMNAMGRIWNYLGNYRGMPG
jgi:hypothetical protein